MQADVAVSYDIVPAPPRWGPWVVPGTQDHVPSIPAQHCHYSDSDFSPKFWIQQAPGWLLFMPARWSEKFLETSAPARTMVPTAAICLALGKSVGRWLVVCDGVFLHNHLLHQSPTSSGTPGSACWQRATWYPTANYAEFPLAPSLSADLFICFLHRLYDLWLANGNNLVLSRMDSLTWSKTKLTCPAPGCCWYQGQFFTEVKSLPIAVLARVHSSLPTHEIKH